VGGVGRGGSLGVDLVAVCVYPGSVLCLL
jgi:hypothetical protein